MWQNTIKKKLTNNPLEELNKIIRQVDGIKYIISNGHEGKMVSNPRSPFGSQTNMGDHSEFEDIIRLAKVAIKELEDFADESNIKDLADKEYRMQQDAGEAHAADHLNEW